MNARAASGSTRWDAIVIGGGHAGCEAAHALATLGHRTLLLTMNVDTIGHMSCNPAIGGMAKGHLVREIDALGGIMGRVADAATIHFKRLNTRKGPAVRSSRAQADMAVYRARMQHLLMRTDNLWIKQGSVTRLLLDEAHDPPRCVGVVDQLGVEWLAEVVVMTTGTFLRGRCHVGLRDFAGGRAGDAPSLGLSEQLAARGVQTGRLKTGTTPRLDARSIDWDRLEAQPGDDVVRRFSFHHDEPRLPQVPCHITWTTPRTHEIIRAALDRSPMFTGVIEGIGPRYCPSIEDKVHRFADRDRHQIFLEPQGLQTLEVYPNGISTSLPFDVQVDLVRSIPGLERAEIMRPGYAVEYDFINPVQLDPSLELRAIRGLFLAGQINGTSGYEEAAAQGLLAGINAAHALRGRDPVVLRRDEAYIGVLIDDLVTRGADEPYRMFTSRAEFRLLLREDNADERLTPVGRRVGLIGDDAWTRFEARRDRIDAVHQVLRDTRATPTDELRRRAEQLGIGTLDKVLTLESLLARPENSLDAIARLVDDPALLDLPEDVAEAVEIRVRYRGYLERQTTQTDQLRRMDDVRIPGWLDLATLPGLSNEVREKLLRVRPASLGQASRIQGVTPAAITNLWIFIRRGPTGSAAVPE